MNLPEGGALNERFFLSLSALPIRSELNSAPAPLASRAFMHKPNQAGSTVFLQGKASAIDDDP